MSRLARVFVLAFLLLGPLAASGCTAPTLKPVGPAIWHLADKDSDIWLFGTVHLLPPDLNWQSAPVDQAFDAADTIYFETQTDNVAQAKIAALVTTMGHNPAGVTLSSMLPEADRALLAKVSKRVNVDPAAFEGERPWLVGVQLSVAYVMSQGLAPTSGVEHVLDERANKAGKKRAYFETAEEQLSFFANLPRPIEIGFLRATLHEIEDEDENVDLLNKAWARGDVKTLGHYFAGMTGEVGPEVYAVLIRDRNKRWADDIDKMMQGSGKTFIAVGAAHLIGPDSVTALLRKKGYKVEGP
jgi:hypothetical protein